MRSRRTQADEHQFLQRAHSPSHTVIGSDRKAGPEPSLRRQQAVWVANPGITLLKADLVANLPPKFLCCFLPYFCGAANISSTRSNHCSEYLHTEMELIVYVEFIEPLHGRSLRR
jgi:hypothetical protein